MKKNILIVTERRADFSRFKPILKLIKKDKNLEYKLIVTGLHLVKKYGYTNLFLERVFQEGGKVNKLAP